MKDGSQEPHNASIVLGIKGELNTGFMLKQLCWFPRGRLPVVEYTDLCCPILKHTWHYSYFSVIKTSLVTSIPYQDITQLNQYSM